MRIARSWFLRMSILVGILVIGACTETMTDPEYTHCTTVGNRVCGPNHHQYEAGCYRDGQLVIPWTNYERPELDPLYGQQEAC